MRHFISCLSVIALLSACSPSTKTPEIDKALAEKEANIQREIALKEDRIYYERALAIGSKVKSANTELCGKKIAPDYGFTIGSLEGYPKEYKDVAKRLFSVQEQPTVYHVVPTGIAASKLQMGDAILSVNDKTIKSGKSGLSQLAKYRDDKDLIDKPMTLLIERMGVQQQVTLTPKATCSGSVVVANQSTINAYADGKNIIITKGMMDFAKEDQDLALVVGHELAHNTRKHIEAKKGNAMLGMVLGAVVTGVTGVNVMGLGSDLGARAYSQGFEAEADYVGLYHAARAGYDVSEAANLWRRMGAKNPSGIHLKGSTHPSTAKRFVALEIATKEVMDKQAQGQPLVPTEKEKKEYKEAVGEYN